MTAEPATDHDGLSAEGIVVRFGGLVAVDGISFQAPRSRITGLIGPNGAGKTTTFNVCCGFQRADAGTVALDGVDITGDDPAARARRGIGRTFQRMELFRSLTVRENIGLAAELEHLGRNPLRQLGAFGGRKTLKAGITETVDEMLEACGLTKVADHLASELSTGQGRLVELARALARHPQILLLDEPSSGLDVRESAAFGELLVRLVAERHIGILMIEHDMSLVLNICDWIHVLDFGKPLMAGTASDVRHSEEVRNAYLGKSAA